MLSCIYIELQVNKLNELYLSGPHDRERPVYIIGKEQIRHIQKSVRISTVTILISHQLSIEDEDIRNAASLLTDRR